MSGPGITHAPATSTGVARIELYDRPGYVKAAEYERCVMQFTREMAKQAGVVAIYQLGGVGAPGISDLDMLLVFADGVPCAVDPLRHLDDVGRYVFTHGVFAVARRHFEETRALTLVHGYRLWFGTELRTRRESEPDAEPAELRRQVAVEYLLANYLARNVEAVYGLVSVRGLLLWGHALRYDLALLGIDRGRLAELVEELIDWRGHWFEKPVPAASIVRWFHAAVAALHATLSELLDVQRLALPIGTPFAYARHIRLRPSHRLAVHHRGVRLPLHPDFMRRRSFRLQHRLNRFVFDVPWEVPRSGSLPARRFDRLQSMARERRMLYPRFAFCGGGMSRVFP